MAANPKVYQMKCLDQSEAEPWYLVESATPEGCQELHHIHVAPLSRRAEDPEGYELLTNEEVAILKLQGKICMGLYGD